MNTDNDWPRMNTDKHGMTDARLLRDQRMQPPFEVAQRSVMLAGVIRLSGRWIPPAETNGSRIVSKRNIQARCICVHLCASVASLGLSPCESVAGRDLWR